MIGTVHSFSLSSQLKKTFLEINDAYDMSRGIETRGYMVDTMPIQEVLQTLEDVGLSPTYVPGTKEIPFDVALASLGLDEKNRSLVLQVQQHTKKSMQAVSPGKGAAIEDGEVPDFVLLSFLVTVPIEVSKKRAFEVLRFLALSNKTIPLGALQYSEVEKAIYYQYSFPVFSGASCELVVLSVINAISFAKDTFFAFIEDVALGKETVETLIQ